MIHWRPGLDKKSSLEDGVAGYVHRCRVGEGEAKLACHRLLRSEIELLKVAWRGLEHILNLFDAMVAWLERWTVAASVFGHLDGLRSWTPMLGDAEAVFALEVEGRDILIWDLEARGATGSSGRSWPEYSTR